MRYLCVHCDEPFEPEDADKPRCPTCMRTQGHRALAEQSAGESGRRGWLWPALVVAACAAAAAGYLLLGRGPAVPDEGPIPLEPLPTEAVERRMTAQNVTPGPELGLLVAGEKVQAFARASGAKGSAADKARALVEAVRARSSAGAMKRWSRVDARTEPPPRTAEQTAAALAEDGAGHELFPLEVAALAVSALRALEVPAMLAEVHAFEGERSPADPSGRMGYFGAAIPQAGGEYVVFDVYGGRDKHPKPADFSVLDDVAAIGMAMSLSALVALANNEEPSVALALADAAIGLAPSSPSARGARAAVLLSSAGTDEGVREMEAAAQLRRDAPRRNNLAMVRLAQNDRDRAAKEVAKALEQFPDYASARVTLATVHLAGFEREQARAELGRAEQLEPRMSILPLAWAQYHAANNELPQAIARAQAAVEMRPKNAQARLTLARMYRQASQFDPMRVEAREVMALTPSSQRDRMREVIEALLGPTALEAPIEAAPVDAGAPALAGPGDLDLSRGSTLLGSDDDTDAPSLLDSETDLNLDPGGSKLRLRAPGSRLKLDLGQ